MLLFIGILDQGNGHLIIYEAADEDNNFKQGVEIISNISLVVEVLLYIFTYLIY